MVAREEDLVTVEVGGDWQGLGDLAEGEITDDPDGVALGDGLVPVVDEGAVHRIDVGERAVAVVDDVAVAEVEVGGEPGRHSCQGSHR